MFDGLDLRLYAIIDPEQAGGWSVPELACMVTKGGATLVQLRDKVSDTRDSVALARAVKAALPKNVPLIVNDRIDVAIEVGADGVHLGQEDLSVVEARERLGPVPFIGLTVQTVEHAQAAPFAMIDYVGIGGVFATSSKNNPRPPIGIAGLREIIDALRDRVPACAIAGITKANAADVINAGADGISVISALSRSEDPAAAAHELRAVIDAALAQRERSTRVTRRRQDGVGA